MVKVTEKYCIWQGGSSALCENNKNKNLKH